jgi:hypothetical protein
MRTLYVTLLLAVTALGQEKAAAPAQTTPTTAQTPAQGPPPKNLTKLPDGHFSANSDPKNPENFEIHVVVRGDTLSAIAKDVLSDGRLWPQIWEQNEHIVNPHWIYPNDKILIKPITKISEAKPPEPTPEAAPATAQAPAPAPEVKDTTPAPPQPLKGKLVVPPYPSTEPPRGPTTVFNLSPPRSFPEVKEHDLYCSGFIRTEAVPRDIKVVARYSNDEPLASAGDYVYVGVGAQSGVRLGDTFQVIRPTKNVDTRKGGKNLGMHYIEVAQVQVVMGQADYSLARVTQGCENVEIGDVLIPFNKLEAPALPAQRPFSGTMKTSGQMPGHIVLTKQSINNSGSQFSNHSNVPGASKFSRVSLQSLDRGVAAEGAVVYIDIGKSAGAKPGDIFIVFHDVDGANGKVLIDKEKGQRARIAVAELVIVKVEDLASTALVTYADDVVSQGDAVERR